jgi:enediyne biosynthesis protein E4
MLRTLFFFTVLLLSCTQKPSPRFALVSPSQSNVDFQNSLPEQSDEGMNIIQYLYYYNGGGVAAGDLNNDGWTDLYFSANLSPNKLYWNRGDFRFEDGTERAKVAAEGAWKTGVTLADVNGDGWLDIYQCRVGKYKKFQGQNQLFINNQDGTFTEKSAEYGLDIQAFCTQAAFADVDRDGDLDCYLLCHSVHSPSSYKEAAFSRKPDPLSSDRLLRNDGGHFTDITAASGLQDGASGYGLGLVCSDLDSDGFADIYVANDFHENDFLYRNQSGAGFRDEVVQSLGHCSNFSMGCDAADINNDGWIDIVTLDMKPEEETILKASAPADPYPVHVFKHDYGYHWQFARNNLQLNQGVFDGRLRFSEIGQLSGVATTDWSWCALFADLDLDGWKDLYVTNGIPRRPNDSDYNQFVSSEAMQREASDLQMLQKMPAGDAKNYCYRNKGELRFENLAADWGLDLRGCSHGAAYADLDNDGDWDLVCNNLNAPASVYKNQTTGKNYLKIRLRDTGSANGFALGARIEAVTAQGLQVQEIQTTRGIQSASESAAIFGLDSQSTVSELRVRWPDGTVQALRDLAANQTLTITKNALPAPAATSAPSKPFFSEKTTLPYADSSSDTDIKDLRLLPWSLSARHGHWTALDLNGDGLLDLLNAKSVLFQGKNGNFTASTTPHPFAQYLSAQTTCIRPCDYDADGDTDFFIGKRFDAFAYGIGTRSTLLRNDGNGRYVEQPLPDLAECSDAQWLDVDGDKRPDLVTAGNWMPLTVLLNRPDGFESHDVEGSDGLWNCLSTPADSDGDGDLDLVAGNWGLNSNLQASAKEPLGLWVKDFDGNSSFDPILSYYRQGKRWVFADKNLLVSQMPNFRKRYLEHKKYAESEFDRVFDADLRERAQHRQAHQLQSCYVENQGSGNLILRPLPVEAQFSMVQGATFLHLNGDGFLDILLAGNQSSIQPAIGRMDAGLGCALLGDGKGGFRALPNREAGLFWPGEVTDLLVFPVDGKPMLLWEEAGRVHIGKSNSF